MERSGSVLAYRMGNLALVFKPARYFCICFCLCFYYFGVVHRFSKIIFSGIKLAAVALCVGCNLFIDSIPAISILYFSAF